MGNKIDLENIRHLVIRSAQVTEQSLEWADESEDQNDVFHALANVSKVIQVVDDYLKLVKGQEN